MPLLLLTKLLNSPKWVIGILCSVVLISVAVCVYRAGIHHSEANIAKQQEKASEELNKENKQVIDIESNTLNNLTAIEGKKDEVLSNLNVNDARGMLNQLYSEK